MAVYTILSEDQIFDIMLEAQLGTVDRLDPILTGVENTNYYVRTSLGKYILTIFEKRTDVQALPFVFSLQDHLNKYHISCPKVLHGGQIDGKYYAISSFLNGQDIENPTQRDCFYAGQSMADMHRAAHSFEGQRANPFDQETLMALLNKNKEYLDEDRFSIIKNIIETKVEGDVFRGPVHGDYFPDNVFFNDNTNANTVSGVIDFYFSCVDFYIYDIAIAMNAWPYADDFLDGYESVRCLSDDERQGLVFMRQKAAVRIYLTRLYDFYNTPSDAQIVKKDPAEYWSLIEELLK